jgi:TspO/MBR family
MHTNMKYLNLLLFSGMVVMNYLANALPLNGKTTGELSDAYPNLFVPAGVTFSIWGIIYILLIVFCVVQFTTSQQAAVSRIGWLFGFTCLFNALWLVAWHYGRLPLSLIMMLGLLVSLIWINTFIRELPYGFFKAAFGIYLGWICIATIANITALLVNYGWGGFGISEETWAIIMIIVGALLASVTIWRLDNPFIGLAVVWAFVGITIKRQDDYRAIFITAAVAAVAVTAVLVLSFFRRRLFAVA